MLHLGPGFSSTNYTRVYCSKLIACIDAPLVYQKNRGGRNKSSLFYNITLLYFNCRKMHRGKNDIWKDKLRSRQIDKLYDYPQVFGDSVGLIIYFNSQVRGCIILCFILYETICSCKGMVLIIQLRLQPSPFSPPPLRFCSLTFSRDIFDVSYQLAACVLNKLRKIM